MHLLAWLVVVAAVAAVVAVVLVLSHRKSSRGGYGGVRRSSIRDYARRYRERFPDTRAQDLRDSLREKFLPQRIGKRDDSDDAVGCLFFGFEGLAAAMLGHALAARGNDAEIERIKDDIDDVVRELFPGGGA